MFGIFLFSLIGYFVWSGSYFKKGLITLTSTAKESSTMGTAYDAAQVPFLDVTSVNQQNLKMGDFKNQY